MSEREVGVTALCDRIGPYFDGELSPAEEQRFARHLGSCARCQAELEDLLGLEAARAGRHGKLAPLPAAAPVSAPRRRPRWIGPAAAAGVLVVAAVLLLVLRRQPTASAPPMALAALRGVEVRFAARAFDRHRPYDVVRGDAPRESIAMSTMAALERAGDRGGLVAASALVGELQRARSTLDAMAPAPAVESDRAALALIAGRAEEALAASERALHAAPGLTTARWNRALALRDLELPLAAAAAFDAVAAAGEPGWSAEARERATAARRVIDDRDAGFAAMRARAPRILAEDARAFPGYARLHFLDALRLADDAAALDAMRGVADELDAVAGDRSATLALTAVRGRDLAVRRRFHARYRALVNRALPAAEVDGLVAELTAAGEDARDLLAGAIILAGRTVTMEPALRAALGADPSPWFTLLIERERLLARRRAGHDIDAELAAAVASCDAVRWAYRCARLELDLAELLTERGRVAEAFAMAARARHDFAAAGAHDQSDGALTYQGELARHAGRDAIALAIFDEITARAAGEVCELERYGHIGAAVVSLARGDLAAARARLPDAATCGGAPDGQGIAVAVDLARAGDAADRARAEAWLTTATDDAALTRLAEVGRGRLAIVRDASGGRTMLKAALAAAAGERDVRAGWMRAWATAALISDGGARGDWPAVFADAAAEAGVAVPDRCAVVVSTDDARVVTAVRDASGAHHGEARELAIAAQAAAALVSPALLARLSACPQIAVLARAPLHGRASLLPPQLPWFFVAVGGPSPADPPPAPQMVVVSDPASPSAPRLTPVHVEGATNLTGAAAQPSAVLAALRTATYAELHVHGVADLEAADGSYLLLAPDAAGRDHLTARQVAATRLIGAPVIVLAACRAADVASHLRARWSLPDAFIAAGARAVIAADTDLPDQQAAALFAELRRRVSTGAHPAAVLAELRGRAEWAAWAGHLMLFHRL